MASTLWLVDRSRIVDGRGFCQRSRYLNYHAGPNGYGIARKATKLPLMTGIGGHEGLAPVLEWCRDHDDVIQQQLEMCRTNPGGPIPFTLPPALFPFIRAGIGQALETYQALVAKRGFAYLSDTEETQYVIREQRFLIEGLIWSWCLDVLPEILERGRVIEVEMDDTYVIGCTCGLGDGILSKADHEARDCQGLGLMCKPDFLLETRTTQELEYHEFKTTSMDSITFRDKWEVMVQLFASTLDAERRHGRHVQSIYIHGLVKGRRTGDYNPETKKYDGGMIKQQSVFSYGYRKPGNPPMEREEWAAQWEYVDEMGANRRLGKGFKKAGVWELPDAIVPEGMSKGEFWAQWIGPEVRRKNLVLIGPLSRQSQMIEHFIEETLGEEHRWQQGLWELYELAQQLEKGGGYWVDVWQDPQFQQRLNSIFPRSYECRRYGARNRCQFEGICLIREGTLDPVGSGQFIERRPHHVDELDQAVDRGLLLPEEGMEEQVEMELP